MFEPSESMVTETGFDPYSVHHAHVNSWQLNLVHYLIKTDLVS